LLSGSGSPLASWTDTGDGETGNWPPSVYSTRLPSMARSKTRSNCCGLAGTLDGVAPLTSGGQTSVGVVPALCQ
jgi:hypothetical protein